MCAQCPLVPVFFLLEGEGWAGRGLDQLVGTDVENGEMRCQVDRWSNYVVLHLLSRCKTTVWLRELALCWLSNVQNLYVTRV